MKSTTIRRRTVQETAVSRHHEWPNKGPLETPRSSQFYGIERFKGAPIMPKGLILSGSQGNIFQPAMVPLCRKIYCRDYTDNSSHYQNIFSERCTT